MTSVRSMKNKLSRQFERNKNDWISPARDETSPETDNFQTILAAEFKVSVAEFKDSQIFEDSLLQLAKGLDVAGDKSILMGACVKGQANYSITGTGDIRVTFHALREEQVQRIADIFQANYGIKALFPYELDSVVLISHINLRTRHIDLGEGYSFCMNTSIFFEQILSRLVSERQLRLSGPVHEPVPFIEEPLEVRSNSFSLSRCWAALTCCSKAPPTTVTDSKNEAIEDYRPL